MQEVIFFFDDSGVFHKNADGHHFVYAGYVFTSREELNNARRKYINANKKLKQELGRNDELKACNLKPKQKRALFNSVKGYDSVSVVVDLRKIYNHILNNKHSICRYKDYAIKRCVKDKLKQLIDSGLILNNEDIKISIYIDQQLNSSDGYYNLKDLIQEELRYGVENFNYGMIHPNLFESNVDVQIKYCDSSMNYMIQASDILANRIWTSYICNNVSLRKIDNHMVLTLP